MFSSIAETPEPEEDEPEPTDSEKDARRDDPLGDQLDEWPEDPDESLLPMYQPTGGRGTRRLFRWEFGYA
jgi:hypothetical protein